MIGAEFSDQDFERLSDWLNGRVKGITDVVELEGFLTAIVIGPNMLSPLVWLPRVWGGRPNFRDLEEMNRFVALVMDFYNSIVLIFEASPGEFEPTFYERKIRGKTVSIVDEWCWGFMKGLRLDTAGWKPLKRQRPELLKPLELFGTCAGFRRRGGQDARTLVAAHRTGGARHSRLLAAAPAARAFAAPRPAPLTVLHGARHPRDDDGKRR